MTTVTTPRHHTPTAEAPSPPSPPDAWRVRTAREQLSTLLEQAALLDFDDAPGWAHLRATSHATTTVLRNASLLPPHLHVRHDDPPVIVARTIAAAAAHVGDPVPVARHAPRSVPGRR
ncbi:hypothetical protein [Nitriliruptor alkaliphilus]|uniref:hypothetical protein n=1 Tax=Nitriliruptor alkaliphilus TaxID=427918 RepID=UPI000697CADD|nr:hypothetical protein [Nitriliruptor alkaliphilus]